MVTAVINVVNDVANRNYRPYGSNVSSPAAVTAVTAPQPNNNNYTAASQRASNPASTSGGGAGAGANGAASYAYPTNGTVQNSSNLQNSQNLSNAAASRGHGNRCIKCPCGRNDERTAVVQCEDPDCGTWQHLGCMGLPPNFLSRTSSPIFTRANLTTNFSKNFRFLILAPFV